MTTAGEDLLAETVSNALADKRMVSDGNI